jgi:PBP1b-binding outer membrane lipoprotein LpoB
LPATIDDVEATAQKLLDSIKKRSSSQEEKEKASEELYALCTSMRERRKRAREKERRSEIEAETYTTLQIG